MARKDRTGNRKTRDQRAIRRIPEMGYYLVVTDTEATERCFFTGLHNSLPEDTKKKLVIKLIETKTQNLIQIFTNDFVNTEMKIKQFHHKCVRLQRYISWWVKLKEKRVSLSE